MHEIMMSRPVKFDPYDPENTRQVGEEQLADMIATMEDNGTHQASEMSEFSFYMRVKYLKKKFKVMSEK
jgi:hypothetical protein